MSQQNKKGVRGYLKYADSVELTLITKLKQIEKLQFGDTAFYEGNTFYNPDTEIREQLNAKPLKGASHRESLRLYKEGKTVEEIAAERGMAAGTIETHLASFIPTGEIDIYTLLASEDLQAIKQQVNESNDFSLSLLKTSFGDRFTFGQLRMAVAYLQNSKE